MGVEDLRLVLTRPTWRRGRALCGLATSRLDRRLKPLPFCVRHGRFGIDEKDGWLRERGLWSDADAGWRGVGPPPVAVERDGGPATDSSKFRRTRAATAVRASVLGGRRRPPRSAAPPERRASTALTLRALTPGCRPRCCAPSHRRRSDGPSRPRGRGPGVESVLVVLHELDARRRWRAPTGWNGRQPALRCAEQPGLDVAGLGPSVATSVSGAPAAARVTAATSPSTMGASESTTGQSAVAPRARAPARR